MPTQSRVPGAASSEVDFELERFERTGEDRIEIAGRWYGLRGRRFVRPVLNLHMGGGSRRRAIALLEHKPWAADDGETWLAAFAWPQGAGDVEGAELEVGPGLIVDLPAPGGKPHSQGRVSALRPHAPAPMARRIAPPEEEDGDGSAGPDVRDHGPRPSARDGAGASGWTSARDGAGTPEWTSARGDARARSGAPDRSARSSARDDARTRSGAAGSSARDDARDRSGAPDRSARSSARDEPAAEPARDEARSRSGADRSSARDGSAGRDRAARSSRRDESAADPAALDRTAQRSGRDRASARAAADRAGAGEPVDPVEIWDRAPGRQRAVAPPRDVVTAALEERDAAVAARDEAERDRVQALNDRDDALSRRDAALRDVDRAVDERDDAVAGRARLESELERVTHERDVADAERKRMMQDTETVARERDQSAAERDAARSELSRALPERDHAMREAETAAARADRAESERDTAFAERKTAVAQRDRARRERDRAMRAAGVEPPVESPFVGSQLQGVAPVPPADGGVREAGPVRADAGGEQDVGAAAAPPGTPLPSRPMRHIGSIPAGPMPEPKPLLTPVDSGRPRRLSRSRRTPSAPARWAVRLMVLLVLVAVVVVLAILLASVV